MNLVNFRWLSPLCVIILFNLKEICAIYPQSEMSDIAGVYLGIVIICIFIIAVVGTLSIISQGFRLLLVKENTNILLSIKEETNIKKLTKEQIQAHLETMENLK